MSLESIKVSALPTIAGFVFGILGTSFAVKDRMVKQVEAEVTERVTIATKLARIEERLKTLEAAGKVAP